MIREIDCNSDIYFKTTRAFKIIEENDDKSVVESLYKDLIDTIKANPDRYYLCSNEIGREERGAVIKFGDEYLAFFNLIFQEKLSPQLVREIDVNDKKEYILPRFLDTTICYQDITGAVKAHKLNDEASLVFCQVINCLNGIHNSDIGLEIIPEFDEATDEEREEVIAEYLKSITESRDILEQDIMADEESRKIWQQFKFDSAVADGKVEFEEPERPPMNRKQRRFLNKIAKKLNKKGGKD